jgi:hypothetical protein
MRTLLICLLFLLRPDIGTGQVKDDFDDEDLSLEPLWHGMVSSFISVNGELRSNHPTVNSMFYASTANNFTADMEWRLDCKILYNTSSVNYVDFVLLSDSMNLMQSKNAYFVRLGGSTDEVSLYKTQGGIETKIIDGADGVLNSSNNQYAIIVQRFGDSFVLHRTKAGASPVKEGHTVDAGIKFSSYSGIRIRQSTSSFFNKHFFDNLYIGPVIRDTLPPVWDSLVYLDNKHIRCVFNEICDSFSLRDTAHYKVRQNGARPLSAVTGLMNKWVTLTFENPFQANHLFTLDIEGIKDVAGNVMQQMESKDFFDSKPDTPGLYDLVITELMVDPEPQVALPIEEYVEITNISGKFLQLNGCRIYDPTSYKVLPNLILPPDSILVLKIIPSLNNASDKIWIRNQKQEIIHKVEYTDQWYRDEVKKAGGYSLEMIDYDQPCLGAINWQASIDIVGGTPGRHNSVKGPLPKDTVGPILLGFNMDNDSMISFVFNEPVDSISLLSTRFMMDGQTVSVRLKRIQSEGNVVLWVLPFLPQKTKLYKLSFSGVGDCSGNKQKDTELELQWPSESHKGDMLLNEILFNPRSGGHDFIEIYNCSELAFDLSKHFLADIDAGGLLKGVYKMSKDGQIVKPSQYVLLTEDTSRICMEYLCKNKDMLKVQMDKLPAMPDEEGTIILLNSHDTYIDSLHYFDKWHFPLISDRSGVSLERLNWSTPTNIRDNWHSAASTAGYATPGAVNSQIVFPRKVHQYFTPHSRTLSPDQDGFEDLMVLRYKLPAPDYLATVMIYDVEGRLVRHLVNNLTLGTEGILSWDGTDAKSRKVPIGIYIVWIECMNPQGERIRQKLSVVVAERM